MANGTFGGGTGKSVSPYLIEDAADLNAMRNNLSAYYKLVKNVDLAVAPYNTGTGWLPISNFAGFLDGDGHVIKNLMINNGALVSAGLFASMAANAWIKDLGLVHVNITADQKVGAFVGSILGNSVNLTRCYSTGTISGNCYVGGLVGEITQRSLVTLSNCHSKADLTIVEEYCGGIVGFITAPISGSANVLIECFFNGTLNGGNLVTTGPVYGEAENLTITRVFYDQSKITQKCLASGVTAFTTAQMQDSTKFEFWKYVYLGNVPVWKFPPNSEPKLWYEDTGKFLLAFNGGFYRFDDASGNWLLVDTVLPSTAVFWTSGMSTLKNVPIAKMRELEQYITVDVYQVIESLAQGAETTGRIELIFDVERTSKGVIVTQLTEKPLSSIETDYNAVSRSVMIEQEDSVSNGAMNIEIASETEKTVNAEVLIDEIGHIQSKDIYVTSDAAVEDLTISKGLSVANVAAESKGNNPTFIGFTDISRQCWATGVKETALAGVNINVTGETEAAISADQLASLDNHIKSKDILATVDEKQERTDIAGSFTRQLYRTAAKRNRAIHIHAKGESRSRYLISINNGGKWLTYNTVTSAWVETGLDTATSAGLTMAQMADPSIWDSLPTNYKSKVKCAIGIRSESFNTTHKVNGLQIEFEPNQGPQINSASVQLVGDQVVATGTLLDGENDNIEYQILTKQFGETEWRQLTPGQPGWFKRDNGYVFNHAYELSNFRAGDNYIKICTRDSRGATCEKEFELILVTGEPVITVNSQNEFYMNATVDHSLGKKIRFRIYANGNQMSPVDGWTEWKTGPFTFDFSWDSDDLLYGLPNEIKIEAIDELNSTSETKFIVLGGYRSLLFKDVNGFYYSTDKGEILQQLDFGTIIGGLMTDPQEVFLENRTGLALENVTVWADNLTQEANVKLHISETLEPFVPVETITFGGTMPNGELKPFYARIDSDIDMTSIERKVFKVYAKGDPIVV